jgi:hypothetical protein
VGLDLDLQDGGVVAAGEGVEGLAAAGAVALVGGQVEDFLGGGEVVVVASAVALVAGLLTAPAPGGGRRRGVGAGGSGVGRGIVGVVGVGLGLAAEELLLAESEEGLESCDLVLEGGLALGGALVLGLVRAGLLSGVEEGGEQGTGLPGRAASVWSANAAVSSCSKPALVV